jgi:hypothetical protein
MHNPVGGNFWRAYRLHYFPESGNSCKLALMLTLCGQKSENWLSHSCHEPEQGKSARIGEHAHTPRSGIWFACNPLKL